MSSLKADRIINRLNSNRRRKLESQNARGRPTNADRRCNDPECLKACCKYDEPSVVSMPRETSDNGMSAESTYAQFLSRATTLVWPRRTRVYDLITKYHLAESFITSPPVHAAYWAFINLTEKAGINVESEGQLRGCTLSVLQRFQEVMFNKHKVFDVHRYLETAAGVSIRASLDLSDFVLKYLVSIELWRRREVALGRDWTLEDDECTCSFLASTLLQLWNMNKEGCFEVQVKDASKSGWDILWEQWLDYYPRPDLGDDSEDAVLAHGQFGIRGELMITQTGYIGGVGRCPPGWLQKP